MNAKEQYNALEDLRRSDGWKVYQESLDAWINSAMDQWVDPRVQNNNSEHFLRGALWAVRQLRSGAHVQMLLSKLDGEISMEEARAKTMPSEPETPQDYMPSPTSRRRRAARKTQ